MQEVLNNYQIFGRAFVQIKSFLIILVFISNNQFYKDVIINRGVDFNPKLMLSDGKLAKILTKTKIKEFLRL